MRTIGTQRAGLTRRSGKQQHMAPCPRGGADLFEQRAAICVGQAIVAEDHTAAPRQRGNRGEQPVAQTFIGHQPYTRQRQSMNRVVAHSHAPPYSAAMTQEAKTRLTDMIGQIDRAARRAGRAPQDVALIAISKTRSAEEISPLIAAGQRLFGENRVQEAQAKWPAMCAQTPGIELHLVGQLQSNKAEEAVALFDVIHSVDRLSLITALAKAQDKTGKRPRCFIQVNIGDEVQKGGCEVASLASLLEAATAAGLDVRGLMAVPPEGVEAAPYFALLSKLARDHALSELSMGMSGDFETAIMLGASCVRIGTALFGPRD